MKRTLALMLVVLPIVFITPVSNVFANRALDQMNSVLTSRIGTESIEKAEKAGEARDIENAKDIKNTKEANNLNVDSMKKVLGAGYEFIFFYRSSCPYCRKFDPILKQYSVDTAIPVRAFTFDGIALPSFPDSIAVDKNTVGEYFGDNATVAVPALFLMNTINLHAYPVSSGGLSYMDLVMRMNALVPKILSVEGSQHV